ncbi:MAG TPA: carbohydrate kinase [Candidatus Atribacteria bacterium]|nr:carbohydrate kinase [Candidatus Atribacteria bacterium]
MAKGYLLGVDIGTYSSKGVLVQEDGKIIAQQVVPHGMDMPKPGYFEHDADRVWWHDFVEIVKNLLSLSGIDPKQILGIGTSAIGSCVLPVDELGRPLRPAILYGIDTRTTQEIEYLEKTLGREEIFRHSGMHLSSQASGPKIMWIKNHEPEVFQKTRWFLTSQAYLVYRLTGEATIDIYTANGYAPLFDVHNLGWREEIASYITPIDRLPKAFWSCEIAGRVTEQAARETGLASDTPVIVGTTDAAAEAISTGVREFNDMMLMFGSSIFFIVKTADLVNTSHFWSAPFLEKDAYTFLGGTSTAGSLTTWFRNQFAELELEKEKTEGGNAYDRLAKLAAQSPPGAKGLIILPYFEGERTPLNDPRAKGMFFGISLRHTKADIYRAILEGVGYGIRHNLEVMEEEGVKPGRILATGGGTKNDLWMQIVADIARVELAIPKEQIGASYGDAFMAGVGVGLFQDLADIDRWVQIGKIVQPDLEASGKYDFNYRLFRSLYENTKPLMHELSDSLSE